MPLLDFCDAVVMPGRKFLLSACTLLMLLHHEGRGQEIIRLDSGKLPVVCFAGKAGWPSRIAAPESFNKGQSGARIKSASIQVEYFGFTQEARQAFEHATSIWESLLTSPVEIRVAAVWTNLPGGTLGSAGPAFWAANFTGTPKHNVYYPGPLAEKLAGEDLNGPEEYDIVAQFNSSADWHFESSGMPDAGEFDFITVVLHELGHGLGFTSTFEVEDDIGRYGRYTNNGVPFTYDLFLVNGSSQNLFETFASPSAQLAAQLTGNNVHFKSPFGATIAKVFAPGVFSEGSSISHLDPVVFPQGSPNSLMRPFVNPNEVNHDPGVVLQRIFRDMGWVTTYITHDHLKDREDVTNPIEVKALITADGTPGYAFLEDQVILTYSRSDQPGTTEIAMHQTAVANEFAATLPAPLASITYSYHITVKDNLGRTLHGPGEFYDPQASPGVKGPITSTYSFKVGPDNDAPLIAHTPKAFISYLDDELVIDVEITEGNGIATAQLEFAFNDDPGQLSSLSLIGTEADVFEGSTIYRYRGTVPIAPGQLQDGDEVSYRILAADNAGVPNEATLPATGYFHIPVEGLAPSRTYYANNFDEPSDDFIGTDFTVADVAGFHSPAIHSPHPYPEAGSGNQLDLTYQLRIPIIVTTHTTKMSFDEVVIVEPGEAGSVFGDPAFYDYVVVEGSRDGGMTWIPLGDGYDSRDNSIWISAYNSAGTGRSDFFRNRTVDLLDFFSPGDEVVFRFRLFSDPFGNGWGWAIDNLKIQADDIGPVILHSHLDYISPGTSSLALPVTVSDDQQVENVTLEYYVAVGHSGSSTIEIGSKQAIADFTLDISDLASDGYVYYRYHATDTSGNQTYQPADGYFYLPVTSFEAIFPQYANDFDMPSSTDFVGNFFQRGQIDNFSGFAMHTPHPYLPGFGMDNKSDFTLTLIYKIRINDSNPFMKFDEIALVEPGVQGAVFGTPAFRDYLVVEGSKDDGKTWHPFQDGYDASARSEWQTVYTSGGPGTQQLMRQRGIDLTASGDFVAGDEILIRFRLFSDESNTGWGWVIDNLHIQDEVTGLEPDGLVSRLLVYPNPVTVDNSLTIETQTRTPGTVDFTILNGQGILVENGTFPAGPDEVAIHRVPLDNYANGVYLLRMVVNGKALTRKFILAR